MRPIDADALIVRYDRIHVGESGKARKLIEEAPTIDAVPVVHGRWVEGIVIQTDISTLYDYTCSECSIVLSRASNYCPNCGAKMDGEAD